MYKTNVGSLQDVSIIRPELTYAVNIVSQFMQHPKDIHWRAVKQILHYLSNTLEYGLHFTKSSHVDLVGFSDANWPTDVDDRKSTTSSCLFFGGNIISWISK